MKEDHTQPFKLEKSDKTEMMHSFWSSGELAPRAFVLSKLVTLLIRHFTRAQLELNARNFDYIYHYDL